MVLYDTITGVKQHPWGAQQHVQKSELIKLCPDTSRCKSYDLGDGVGISITQIYNATWLVPSYLCGTALLVS